MNSYVYITIITLIAGVGGTGLGGFIGALFKKDSNRTVSLLLSFAGGVMLAVVCFDLLAEAMKSASELFFDHAPIAVAASVAIGVAVVYLLNRLIDERTRSEVPHVSQPNHPQTHDDIDELIHADHLAEHRRHNDSKLSLFVAGVVMACAIALHNLPEGMIIGASFVASSDMLLGPGILMAMLIGFHNIPEGMAVSVPLINGGMRRLRAVLATAACGLPTVIGAWIGLWLGDIGPAGQLISLGFASGAMLYVVFGEIFPQAILMYRSKIPTFFVIIGLLLGLLLIYY